MRSLAWVVFIGVALTTPAFGAPGPVQTPVNDVASMSDEADGEPGGTFHRKERFGPVSYPADATNVPFALDPHDAGGAEAVPVLVLHVAATPADLTALDGLLLDERRHVDAPLSRGIVLFGLWSDRNGDGYVQNDGWESDELLHALQPDAALVPRDALLGRESHATSAEGDEWTPIPPATWKEGSSARALVVYQTGFGSNESFHPDGVAPNRIVDEATYNDGAYETTFAERGMDEDPSLVYPVVYETFVGEKAASNPLAWCDNATTHPQGCREYRRVRPFDEDANGARAFPSDTDVHQYLDATLRDLYVLALEREAALDETRNATEEDGVDSLDESLARADGEVNRTFHAFAQVRALYDGAKGANNGSIEARNRLVGEADDLKSPDQHEAECAPTYGTHGPSNCPPGGYAHDIWYPYLDLKAAYGLTPPQPVTLVRVSQDVSATWNGRVPREGNSGKTQMPGELYVSAQFGLWRDAVRDGYVRDGVDDHLVRGCPDLKECGAEDDPNEYYGADDGDHAEFRNLCTAFFVDVHAAAPDGGRAPWSRGVYVMKPRPGSSDTLTPILDDLADDAQLSLTRSPVTLRLSCNPDTPGLHRPSHLLVFPTGSLEDDIVLDARTPNAGDEDANGVPDRSGVCVRYDKQGLSASGSDYECAFDVDVLLRFAS